MSAPVLVIDDSLTIRKLLELSLTSAGHAVQVAATAADGLALARRLHPRLILLDHVLPDRKGAEVCADLAADPATAAIPVIVMSAKGDDIRPLFRDRPSVVACIGKPFAPAAVTHLVAETLASRGEAVPAAAAASAPEARPEPPTAVFRPQDPATAAAAQVLFTALRERLTLIPSWGAEAVGNSPATFYAKRLLTQDTVARILEGIAPLVAPPPAPPPAPAAEPLLAGSTAVIDLPALLRLLRDLGRTGVLELGPAGQAINLFCERGDVVMAVPSGASAVQAAAAAGLPPPSDTDPAVPPLLAAAAGTPEADAVLYRIGVDAVLALCAAGPQPFRWRQAPALPAAVLSLGRVITAEQLGLERLRLVDDWTQIEAEVTSLDQVCARAPDLAERLRRLTLSAIERQVLTEINGRRAVRNVVERCRLSTFEAFHVLYRLIQTRLVLPRPAAGPVGGGGAPVLCAGPDGRLAGALERILAARGLPPPALAGDAAGTAAILAAGGARAVLIDADSCDAPAIARALRGALETSAATLVALVDRGGDAAALAEAGCDAVLSAPVHANDLHALIGI